MLVTSEKLSEHFVQKSKFDDAGEGQCAKGVANVLESVGVSVTRGHAYTWKDTLPKNGWIKLEGVRAEDAPSGAVVVYDRDPPGQRFGEGGSTYGHVVVVAEDKNGNKQYVSDKARSTPGGTVPDNFVAVYVHPKLTALDNNTMLMASNKLSDEVSEQKRNAENVQNRALLGRFSDESSNSTAFNFEANKNPMMIFAAIISALFNIDMGVDKNFSASPSMLASGDGAQNTKTVSPTVFG